MAKHAPTTNVFELRPSGLNSPGARARAVASTQRHASKADDEANIVALPLPTETFDRDELLLTLFVAVLGSLPDASRRRATLNLEHAMERAETRSRRAAAAKVRDLLWGMSNARTL